MFVGSHSTILLGSPNTFRQISASFDDRCLTRINERLPFRLGRMSGQVGLPWFCITEVHRVVISIGILVAQSPKRVTELMDDHGQEVTSTRIA